MKDCIFCQIVEGKMETTKVWESDDIIAFKDIAPKSPIHVLIVPKAHIESLAQAEDKHEEILGKLLLAARDVAEKLGIADAFGLKIYSGKDAGQTVFHLHIHLHGGWKTKQKH